MSFTIKHPSRDRLYTRRFDYEDARRRYAAGERVADLAAEYGVTTTAVYHALTPERHNQRLAANKRRRTGVCEVCGGPAMRFIGAKLARNPDGRLVCQVCRSRLRRERLRYDDAGALIAVRCSHLDCAAGDQWQPPTNFGPGPRFRDVRDGGIKDHCRACDTRQRQEYRARHRKPCEGGCGTMVEGKGRPNRGAAADRPFLCRQCWQKRRKADAV